MTRRTQRERDRELIAEAGPWTVEGAGLRASRYWGTDCRAPWSGVDAALALQRETARIAREVRAARKGDK